MTPRSLVILTHALQGLAQGYFAAALAEQWRAGGRRVEVHQGLARPPAADAALLHVDLTRLPRAYLELAARYPLVLNARPLDIAKRSISRNLVSRDEAYDGPVMVKSDANAFGNPERRLALAGAGAVGRWREALLDRLPGALSGRLPAGRYPFYARKSQVPGWVWRQPALVVERFLPEPQDGGLMVNQAYCFGRRWVLYRFVAPGPVVKIEQATRIWPLADSVPPEIEARRAALGLDFGKIDYVRHQGRIEVLDVARTPWLGAAPWNERQRQAVAQLAAGLDDYPLAPSTTLG